MNSHFCKLAVFLALLSLLASGCSFLRRQPASPHEVKDPVLRTELKTLKRENAALKIHQKKVLQDMAVLTEQLAAERAEQGRFREMMATNFDLLEQSVALSLSKAAPPVVEPVHLKLPAPGAPREKKLIPLPPAVAAPQPSQAAGAQARPSLGAVAPADSRAAALAKGPARPEKKSVPVKPVALSTGKGQSGQDEQRALEDPDLIPPVKPRILKSHRAAKALYDKGFYHFAHKDYDQAILIYEDFLARFPADTYSDNAQFWIGESFFYQQRLADAEGAYRKVLRHYEHRSTLEGFKTPESIYRIGATYLKRNDPRRARYYFAAAADRFPQTSAGRKAQRELASLAVKTAGSGAARSPGS